MDTKNRLILNLGCRNRPLDGAINVDLIQPRRCGGHEWLRANVLELDQHFLAESVHEIHSEHLLEHLTHYEITTLLYTLWVLLVPGGLLRIVVPDFYRLISNYRAKQLNNGDFSDADILHIKVFDTDQETLHRTVWYDLIGTWYLTREGFFSEPIIRYPSNIEIEFSTSKI
jgi:predicted SAM-dependent methyltransferase